MPSFSVVWVELLIGLLLLTQASVMSAGVNVTVTPEQGSTITITKDADATADCDACVDGGGNPRLCDLPEFVLSKPVETIVLFNCTQPQDVYKVKTEGKIACTTDACSPEAGKDQASVFTDFHRSFLWTIEGPDGTLLNLDFTGEGLKEVPESEVCADGYLYSVSSTDSQGVVLTQNYCRGGTLTHLELPSKASVSMAVPKQAAVLPVVFNVAPKPKPVKKGRTMAVTPDKDTLVILRREAAGPECSVCVGAGTDPTCSSDLTLRESLNTTIQFTCEKPEDIYTVEINRDFDFTQGASGKKEMFAVSSVFPDFQRTFTWDLKVPSSQTFQLDFPGLGMKQIGPSDTCPDEHTYSIITYQRFGLGTIGTFCKNGSISQIQVLYKGRLALAVPKNKKLDMSAIKVSVGPETKMLAIVQSKLPRGQSYSDFFSANYLRGFPRDETMQWDFVVPPKHDVTVSFLAVTEPKCGSKAVEVRYEQEGQAAVVTSLTEEQPSAQQGSFRLLLQNCDSGRRPDPPGLTLHFRVSALRGGVPHICAVNMQKEAGITLNIENTNPASYCEMKVDGAFQEKITVPPGSSPSLSFLDCPSKDLRITVTKTIECQSLAACPVRQTPLTMPTLEKCLPAPVHDAIWNLRVPEHGTVVLQSPAGTLRQSLPGEECVGTLSLDVAESDGTPIGQFCSGGVIRKVQIHNNVTVTATTAGGQSLRMGQTALFNISFGPEIKESIVYHVQPDPNVPTPVLLGTPGWPRAMKPFATVSWIVRLPSQYRADLLFANVSQPKCQQRHTNIKVQMIGSEEEILSRREDEEEVGKLSVPGSFYLNMSNCQPESGGFSALSKLMVEKKNKMLLGIILGVVGALLVLTLVVVVVICAVTKKKKKHTVTNRVSIYNPKGNLFRPNESTFKPDNGAHIYDAIDENMTYRMGESGYNGGETGVYRPFVSPVEVTPPVIEAPGENNKKEEFSTFLDPADSFGPPRPRTPLGPVNSLGFEDRRMVDNELYTFKNAGDSNPIRLSDVDPLPPPMIDDEWDDYDYDNDEDAM
ncbi:CUB domain-containing protein 1 [Sardina pilchardus]|uniref:CUB domain-containing protein 1 n=1 Tax=Sardina pilchardus TaxID=27697 RepID=UPI002E0F0D89